MSTERRMSYGVLYRTTESAMNVEDWLDANATGEFSVGVEDLESRRQLKTLKIVFDNELDKKHFIENFQK